MLEIFYCTLKFFYTTSKQSLSAFVFVRTKTYSEYIVCFHLKKYVAEKVNIKTVNFCLVRLFVYLSDKTVYKNWNYQLFKQTDIVKLIV